MLVRSSTSHLPRLEVDARINPGVSEVGQQVHHQPDQRHDVERGEYHRVIAVEHALEAEQPDAVEREYGLDQERAGKKRVHERAGKAGDHYQHGVAEDVPIEHLALGAALGARGEHILLANLVEEGVLGEQRHGGERGKPHGEDRQHQVPEIVENLSGNRQLRPIVGGQPAQRENVEERSAGEQDDEQNREQESRDRVADDDDARSPGVELRAVLDRLADAERDRDQIGQEREPNAERNGNRQLLLDELENGGVAKIALAEIEPRIVPQHQEKALVGRLVEAELLLQALDEFRVEALRAAVFGADCVDGGAAAGLPARPEIAARRPRDARGRSGVGARELGDDTFDRPAGGELHHHERDQHDAEQGRDHEQQAPDDVGGHVVYAPALEDL